MDLQAFNFEGANIRTVLIDNEPYFVGKDVAEVLGYSNSSDALSKHVDDDDKQILTSQNATFEIPNRGLNVINESGMYSLVLSSHLPDAKKFKRWVTSEVLPAIRKHGGYLTESKIEDALLNPDVLIKLATNLKEEQQARRTLEVENSKLVVDNEIMQPKAKYFDDLVESKLLTNFRDTAKMIGVKQKEFINYLLAKKYVYRDSSGKLMPYSKHDHNLFEIKEKGRGEWSGKQTFITPQGRETFNLLINHEGALEDED